MKIPVCPALIIALLPFLVIASRAQLQTVPYDPSGQMTTKGYNSEGAVLTLTLFDEKHKRLDRQAVVKLENKATTSVFWQTSQDKAEVTFGSLMVGVYDIEVSAVGYLTLHQQYHVLSAVGSYYQDITLKQDPASIELIAPHSAEMPSKARKETQRALSALKSGDLKQARKRLDAAYKLVPSSSDINFLLGYLCFQEKDLEKAQTYLTSATTTDPRNLPANTMLAQLLIQRGEYPKAKIPLLQAISVNPDYWMAHELLADIYLKEKEYEKAREEAQLATAKGNGGGNAQLVLGEALANLGQRQEAVQALRTFLQNTPGSPVALQVRDLVAELEGPASHPPGASGGSVLTRTSLVDADPMFALPEPTVAIRTWEPPGIDENKPLLANGVTCPSETVIDTTGERIKQLVDDLSRFSAVEDLLHERVDEIGNPSTRETRKFNYVAAISEDKPGFLQVEEFRGEHSGVADFPDHIVSRGFMSLALVFHPAMRDNFQLTCEGLVEWRNQATWLVYFRQRDDRPSRLHDYRIGGNTYSVSLKGRAWITADRFQIVHIESELVKPMPKIRLLTEHQIVDYGPVLFEKRNEELWLPKSAELYFAFQGRRYHRRHSFDHFMLFSVNSEEKRNEPQAKPTGDSPEPVAAPPN
jgi:tetratricopeptide (TPR) repeat protein